MSLSIDEMSDVAARAATLADCLRAEVDAWRDGDDEGAALVARWRGAVAGDDVARWSRRLAWDAIDPTHVRAALGAGAPLDGDGARWLDLLRETALVASDPSERALPHGAERVAFAELLLPFVVVARRWLAERLDGAVDVAALVAPAATADLEMGLLTQLSLIARPVLLHEFAERRARHGDAARTALHAALLGGARRLYDAFAAETLDDGWRDLAAHYPALVRLLALRAGHWVENSAGLLARLAADRAALGTAFAGGVEPGLVTRVETNLSDPHRGARVVSILHFASGLRVVYKPRALGAEAAFSALVGWCNARGLEPALHALGVIDRGEYGWVEYADVRPCDDAAGVARYFERAGMLTCLAYALGGSDLHSGNVRAMGDQPILVDLEVLLAPPVRGGSAEASRRGVIDTVLHTGLVPCRNVVNGRAFVDGGFVERIPGQSYRRRVLRHPNTDLMAWGDTWIPGGAGTNAPEHAGQVGRFADHVDGFCDGFGRAYALLVAHRDALLAPEGPLAPLGDAVVRIVFRPTSVYDAVATRALQPEALRSGVARSIEFERMKAPLLHESARPALWDVWAAEQRQLEAGDVPAFYARAASRALDSACGARVDDALAASGLDTTLDRLRALDADDCALQRRIVRASLTVLRSYGATIAAPAPPTDDASPEADVAEAVRLAELIAELCAGDPATGWVGMVSDRDGSRVSRARRVDESLFDGTAGIGLFLAAAARVTGRDRFRALAEATLAPIRAAVRDEASREALASRVGLGALGIGGIVYALARAGTLLGDDEYLADATAASLTIGHDRIARDTRHDVMFGSAGALLGLLALHATTRAGTTLRQALWCGTHLSTRQIGGSNPYTGHWRTGGPVPETGFAHGTTGIAYALASLYRATEHPNYLIPAVAGFDAVERCWVPSIAAWRDHAPSDTLPAEQTAWCSWCRGAAGIGLARVGALDVLDDRTARHDIEVAIDAVSARDWPAHDHLCCGASGRMELLVAASRRLARPELLAAARTRSARLRRESAQRGGYRAGAPVELAPGLFQGLAGIGYELLRVAHPEAVPSVLLWE